MEGQVEMMNKSQVRMALKTAEEAAREAGAVLRKNLNSKKFFPKK